MKQEPTPVLLSRFEQKFQDALSVVRESFLDDSLDSEASRSITVKITFKPTGDRIQMKDEVSYKLPPQKSSDAWAREAAGQLVGIEEPQTRDMDFPRAMRSIEVD